MKKRIMLLAVLMLTVTVPMTGCSNAEPVNSSSISEATSKATEKKITDKEAVPQTMTEEDVKKTDVKDASEEEKEAIEKILPGIEEKIILLNSKNVDITSRVADEYGIVKEIQVAETDMVTNKKGDYTATYYVTVYQDALQEAIKAIESDKKPDIHVPKESDATSVISMTEKVSVVTQEEADKLAETGKEILTDNGDLYEPEKKDTSKTYSKKTDESDKKKTSEDSADEKKESESNKADTATGTAANKDSSAGEKNNQSAPGEQKKPTPSSSQTATPTPTAVPTPSHTHNWVEQTKTVHHDAMTIQQWVEDSPAWDEPVYEQQPVYEEIEKVHCNGCGNEFDQYSDWVSHTTYYEDEMSDFSHGSYSVVWHQVQTGTKSVQTGTIHHDATGHNETVVVSEAWDETVSNGYKCSGCGATK